MSRDARSDQAPAPASLGDDGRRPRRALVALCVTELTSWGTLYYAFPVVLTELVRDTGWPMTTAMGAFSAGLLTSAAFGAPVGRILDRHGPRRVMTTGSVLGTGALLAVAAAPGLPWFVAAWMLAGLAQSALLYPPAFAALTRWYGPARIRPLTTLSLVAGLSSTVFAPLAALLVTHLGWRATYLVLAGLLAVVTLPLHALFLTPPWPVSAGHSPERSPSRVRDVVRSRAFVLLAAAMSLAGLGLYAATTNLVPLLTSRGISTTTAATALGLCGAGQLLGRLGYPTLTRRTSARTRTTVVLVAAAAGIAALAAIPGPAPLLIAASITAGAVRGTYTLLQATAVGDRWGIQHFATLNALATTPAALAAAVAPAAGALLAGRLGHPAAFALLAAVTLAGAGLAAGATDGRSRRWGRRARSRRP
ncbi:MFS transporter [Nonomuraea sp. SMC257]|uniref:MFS transporter n=1 Tax=Nonomuraea montanisoli TaxID=2741721 RepID=A0A7Y6M1E6_9ACTN|nr:MFS transporter [Nonomuraea montanisoli]NUW30962.1 MFS transporter [Nonomuraea montanisoli]